LGFKNETGAPSSVMGFGRVCGGETEVPSTKPWHPDHEGMHQLEFSRR
jgi:hypothetical protein